MISPILKYYEKIARQEHITECHGFWHVHQKRAAASGSGMPPLLHAF
jgi:hypothetical protein